MEDASVAKSRTHFACIAGRNFTDTYPAENRRSGYPKPGETAARKKSLARIKRRWWKHHKVA
jgi:hypothetical protein